jgi:hypothetical protein
MKPANTKSLIKDFSHLYRNCREGSQSSMLYGFAVGDGWFQILYELSAKIDERARSMGIKPGDERYPSADQVKEKFGGLRFYMMCPDHKIYEDLIRTATSKALHTCEHCGRPGKMIDDGWYSVRCERCHGRKEEIWAEQSAAWKASENAGGYRAPINEAFAEVDAEAARKKEDEEQ